jgi:glucose-1-phosphate adenylyltransferase
MPALNEILAIILGGGAGKRLYPLTRQRAKPAVPIAGKYRLIDVPLSNCINSGINRIDVLTQFNSVSLHRHITQTYVFDTFSNGWVEILAAEQTPRSTDWYQGNADAVRKQLFEIHASRAKWVLVLSGDQLYRMDYSKLAAFHWDHEADVTVAVQPIARQEAFRFGLLKRGEGERITDFVEKPRDPQVLEQFVSRDETERPFLGSMGIYMFRTEVLDDLLENTDYEDFGGQIIPNALKTHKVYGYDFDGFWEDIGTIRSFYETNLSLASTKPPFNFQDPVAPIYTRPRFLPGSVIDGAHLEDVLLADGCAVHRADISHSIVGLRSQISDGVVIKDTIMMGADYFDPPEGPLSGGLPLGIGPNCQISGAILDKNVRIGEGVVIRPFSRDTEIEESNWSVKDGIVVVPKSTVLHPGTYIGPEE